MRTDKPIRFSMALTSLLAFAALAILGGCASQKHRPRWVDAKVTTQQVSELKGLPRFVAWRIPLKSPFRIKGVN